MLPNMIPSLRDFSRICHNRYLRWYYTGGLIQNWDAPFLQNGDRNGVCPDVRWSKVGATGAGMLSG